MKKKVERERKGKEEKYIKINKIQKRSVSKYKNLSRFSLIK